jgi:hypothetical protein
LDPRFIVSAALAASALGAVVHTAPARAQAVVALSQAPVERLKRLYLECDRVTSRERVDATQFAQCAMVGDELLRRGFDGDFDRLLAWWRAEKSRAETVVVAH